MNSRKVLRCAVWGMLWAAFFVFGIWMRGQVLAHGVTEVMGYDYATFMAQFRDFGWITYTGARHPGLGLLASPIVLVAHLLGTAHATAADVFLIAFFSTVSVVNVWLVHRLSGWIGAAVFPSFSFMWLLAAVPESFPVAMTTLLLVVFFTKEVPSRIKSHPAAWAALFVLCSAVTVTNGIKVLIAYLIVNKPTRRRLALLATIAAVVAAVGAGFFALRMARWNMQHPDSAKTIWGALMQTAGWIPEGLGVWGRIKLGVVNFFALPVQPWKGLGTDPDLGLTLPVTIGWIGWCWAGVVYLVAAFGAWRNRHSIVMQVLFGMFTVDAVIHLVCGWGIAEGWLFCAHWFYILPICIGMGVNSQLSTPNLQLTTPNSQLIGKEAYR